MSRRRDLERFAVAQALYDYLGKRIATHNRDGMPGDLRAAANAEAYDAWAEHGADRVTVALNGQTVGALRVNVKESWSVTNPAAFQAWCQDNHRMLDKTVIDLGKLTPAQYEDVASYIYDNLTTEAVYDQWDVPTPNQLGLVWRESEHLAIDPETGEQVPGVEFASTFVGTTVEGFKLDGAKSGAAKKYAPVRQALAGIAPAKTVALLIGAEEDTNEQE